MIAANEPLNAGFLSGTEEMGERIRVFDWASTPLGPIERWPNSLKTSLSLILGSRHPMWIGWGPAMTFLYNDANLHVLGRAKHPRALGLPAAEVWAEIWDVCGPLADKVFESGEASFLDDVRLFMDRGDFLEERFYSFSYSPIRDDSGRVCGLFCPSTDVTPKVLNARRLSTLSDLAANALIEKTRAAACATVARTLRKNPDDIPFALLYLAHSNGSRASLEQTIGAFAPAFAHTSTLSLDQGANDAPWPVSDVYRTGQKQTICVRGIAGLAPGLADQRVVEAVVLPVASHGERRPYGVLIAGVNPCRPLDADYLTFFELVAGQAATAIQNARAIEHEKKRADMLAEIDRAKTVFFSNVSHEFRTPLTLMLSPLEHLLAKRDALRPEDHEQIATAHRNSLRLLKLVNSLLDFSRLEAGRLKASYAAADLAALTTDLASNFRSAMQAAGLALVVDCPPLPDPVYVDLEMWEKIVLNLLSNAFKFTFEGTVTVRLRAKDDYAILTVADTGIGIAESELPCVFERFHRVEGAKGRTHEGTGIGLALIQEYVKLHGGTIFASSRLGHGSTFTITLPFGSAHLPAECLNESASKSAPATQRTEVLLAEAMSWLTRHENGSPHESLPPRTEAESITRPRILLADDNADMREHLRHLLTPDYDVVTARNGKEALELIRQSRPDLLLTDVMMPELDGFGLLQAIRAEAQLETLPIIFLSARAGEGMRVEGLEVGADDYLVKPFTPSELRARIGTHIRMSTALRRLAEREATLRAEAEAARDEAISVLESITDGFLALDRDWRIIYVNHEAERLNIMSREEMLGRDYWELFPATIETTLDREFRRAVQEHIPVDFNFYAPWNRWFHVKAYPSAAGGLSVFYEDITARKAAEEELRRSEERFRKVVESSSVGVAVLSLDARFLQANQAFCDLTGYSEEELRALDWVALTHPDDCAAMPEFMARLASGEIPSFVLEKRYFTKDSRTIWVKNSVSLTHDSQGRPEHMIAVCEDISIRQRMEAELRQSEERLRAIVETTPECVKMVAADGTLLHMNTPGLHMIGALSFDALAGKSIYDLVVPEHRGLYREFNERICRGERGSLEFDIQGLTGVRRNMETHAAPLWRPDGSVVQIAISRDVTDRKRRERAALLLSAIVDSSDDAIISKDHNGIITSWNKSAEQVFGYRADEVIGKSITILIPPDRQDEELVILDKLRRGERIDHFETIRRRKDGTLLNVSLTISPVKDASGKTIGASKIARDITEAKQAERASLLLSAIVESSDDAIISKDLNGIITSWNKSAQHVFGYNADEVVGKSITILIPPDRLHEEPEILRKLQRGERLEHFETIRRRKDGKMLDISLTISPVRDPKGRIIGASKIARDISERKHAERAIQELNARLTSDLAAMSRLQQLSTRLVQADDFGELLHEIVDAGIAITGADMGHIQLLEDGELKTAAQRGFAPPFLEFFNSVYDGEAACRTAMQRAERIIVEDVVTSPHFSDATREIMLAAGVRAVQSTPLITRCGHLLGMFSTHFRSPRRPGEREFRMLDVVARQAADLIERKRAETALLASEARFRQLADSMPQMVWTARPDGYVDYYNERWYEFTGYPRDEFGNDSWERILHPDDVERCYQTYYASIHTGEPYRIEYRFWDSAEKRWRWFMGRALAVRDAQGRIMKWFGTYTDIDEQKRGEDELRRANHDLEQFAYSASHDLQEPLRSIKIYSELLSRRYESLLDGEALEFLTYLRAGASRMEMLVRDLLSYTQVTRLEIPNQDVDANEALIATLANLSGAISESGARVTYDRLPAVRVHRTHLRQLFQNLIGNAIKYCHANRQPIIHISGESDNGYWVFSVRDNGIGISPEYKELIFGLFKRLHTSDEYSGTGIGLAICQRIIERYHGGIWVESQLGEGSTFRFAIPVESTIAREAVPDSAG